MTTETIPAHATIPARQEQACPDPSATMACALVTYNALAMAGEVSSHYIFFSRIVLHFRNSLLIQVKMSTTLF